MRSLITALSHQPDPDSAAQELAAQLSGTSLSHLLFFCSAKYDLNELAKALNRHLGDFQVSGCTTAGEITPEGYSQGSITAIGFSQADFSVNLGFVEQLENFPLRAAQQLVDDLRDQVSDSESSFAITLIDGLSIQEELFLATLNAALGAVPNFGGSAGDDINLARTHVFCNGRFHSNAAVVLWIDTPYEFEVFSTHHLLPTETKLVVTEADQQARTVLELDAEPAAEVYQREIALEQQPAAMRDFALHPLAVRLGDEYFIRSIKTVEPDGALKFFCAIETGIVMTVMRPGDLLENIEQQYVQLVEKIGEPQLIIGCDCFLRRIEAQERCIEAQVSELFKKIRLIGLNTYGEQRQGLHINQTLTGVAIGQRKRAQRIT